MCLHQCFSCKHKKVILVACEFETGLAYLRCYQRKENNENPAKKAYIHIYLQLVLKFPLSQSNALKNLGVLLMNTMIFPIFSLHNEFIQIKQNDFEVKRNERLDRFVFLEMSPFLLISHATWS